MNKVLKTTLTAAALWLSAATSQGAGCCHKGCATCPPAPVEAPCVKNKLAFHLVVTPEQYTAEIPPKPKYKVTTKDFETEQPCTQTVPVCVIDRCTGCQHTEYHQETVLKKVKTTCIEIVPEPCVTTEERTRYCTHVSAYCVPVAPPACEPAPRGHP
jgi:hypothetical protein